MTTSILIFYSLEVLAGVSAVCILFTRNVFYAALLLIITLLSVAGIYVLTQAEFMAVTQILIYAGGVLVLIIFGVMLTSKISGKPLVVQNRNWIAGSFVGIICATFLIKLFAEASFYKDDSLSSATTYNSVNQIGILLMSDFVMPFEVAGILLLVALICAAVVASSVYRNKQT